MLCLYMLPIIYSTPPLPIIVCTVPIYIYIYIPTLLHTVCAVLQQQQLAAPPPLPPRRRFDDSQGREIERERIQCNYALTRACGLEYLLTPHGRLRHVPHSPNETRRAGQRQDRTGPDPLCEPDCRVQEKIARFYPARQSVACPKKKGWGK